VTPRLKAMGGGQEDAPQEVQMLERMWRRQRGCNEHRQVIPVNRTPMLPRLSHDSRSSLWLRNGLD